MRSGTRVGPFALVDAIPAGSGAGAATCDSTRGSGAAPGAVTRVFASSERPKTAAPAGSAAARREGALQRSSNAGPAATASRSQTSAEPARRGGEPPHAAVGVGAGTHRGLVHRTPPPAPIAHPVPDGRSSRRGVGKVEQPGWGLGGSAQAAPHGPARAPQNDAVVPVVGVVVGVDPVAHAVVVRTSMESLPLHAAGRRQRMTWWVRE